MARLRSREERIEEAHFERLWAQGRFRKTAKALAKAAFMTEAARIHLLFAMGDHPRFKGLRPLLARLAGVRPQVKAPKPQRRRPGKAV